MIGHIVLNVREFLKSEEFYDNLLSSLGYVENYREENSSYSVKSYKHEVADAPEFWIKCENTAEHHSFVRDIGLDHLAFKVRSKAEVDRTFEKFIKAGTTITRTPAAYPEYSPEYYAFYFRDPDGIPLEVAYY